MTKALKAVSASIKVRKNTGTIYKITVLAVEGPEKEPYIYTPSAKYFEKKAELERLASIKNRAALKDKKYFTEIYNKDVAHPQFAYKMMNYLRQKGTGIIINPDDIVRMERPANKPRRIPIPTRTVNEIRTYTAIHDQCESVEFGDYIYQ